MAANPSIQLGTDGNWAIKEDNLLAYKKDGDRFFNKEFDFTRGSLATFVDKDGLIKYSGVIDTELVVNGDFATDSDWFKTTGWSISNGQAIANTGAYNTLQQVFPIVLGKTYEVKFDVTSITSGSISMTLGANSGLQRNQIGSYTEIIEYNNFFASSGPRSGSGGFVGSIDNVSVKEIQTDVPRIDFTEDTTGHLLLEPQSTNLLPYSEDFTQWFQPNANVVLTSNKAPNGTTNSVYNLTGTAANLYYSGTINVEHTISFYIKSNGQGKDKFKLRLGNNVSVEYTATNKWVRYEFTSTPITSVFGITTSSAPNNEFDLLIWGAQSEQLSYATSYIPTFGSTATRNHEVCTNSGGSVEDFNGEEGVLFIDVARFKNDLNYLTIRLAESNNEDNEVAFKFRNTEGFIFVRTIKEGVSRGYIEYTFPPGEDDSFNKLAFTYQENSCSLWVNGQNVGNFSGPSNLAQGALKYLQLARGYQEPFYGKVKNVQVFKRAMSDGELYLLTVTQYQSYQEMATALNYTL